MNEQNQLIDVLFKEINIVNERYNEVMRIEPIVDEKLEEINKLNVKLAETRLYT